VSALRLHCGCSSAPCASCHVISQVVWSRPNVLESSRLLHPHHNFMNDRNLAGRQKAAIHFRIIECRWTRVLPVGFDRIEDWTPVDVPDIESHRTWGCFLGTLVYNRTAPIFLFDPLFFTSGDHIIGAVIRSTLSNCPRQAPPVVVDRLAGPIRKFINQP
jgi:hypothetical protein